MTDKELCLKAEKEGILYPPHRTCYYCEVDGEWVDDGGEPLCTKHAAKWIRDNKFFEGEENES